MPTGTHHTEENYIRKESVITQCLLSASHQLPTGVFTVLPCICVSHHCLMNAHITLATTIHVHTGFMHINSDMGDALILS